MYKFLLLLYFSFCVVPSVKDKIQIDGNKITVIGEAPIYQGDVQNAKQRAIKDAKIDAVRKLIGEEISARSNSADGESLGSSLLSKTNAFVKSYDIIDEKQIQIDTQPILQITVRCVVEETKLSTAVDALLDEIGNPRIVSVSLVNSNNSRDYNQISQAEFSRILKENGNKVISLDIPISGNFQKIIDSKKINPNSDFFQDIQKRADVLLVSRITLKDQGKIDSMQGQKLSMPLYSVAATGSYQVVLLWGDGKIVVSGNEDSRESDISFEVSSEKAVIEWSKQVAKKLSKKLKQEWFKLSENNEIILQITNLTPNQAVRFKDDLLEFTGIKRVNVRSQNNNSIEWLVIYPGKQQMLQDEIFYKKDRDFGFLSQNKKLQIKSTTRGTIRLNFQ